jgi:polyketide cyclase/dehydrase/lipid transport protein
MMYTQRSAVLGRPVADVFGFLGHPENWPLIEAGLLEYKHLAGPPGDLGAIYLSRQERWGQIAEARMQVTEYAPNRKITVEGDWANSIKPGGGFLVEPVAGGTKVTTFVKVGTRGIARLVVPFMTPMFNRSLDAMLNNLQRVLAQQGTYA